MPDPTPCRPNVRCTDGVSLHVLGQSTYCRAAISLGTARGPQRPILCLFGCEASAASKRNWCASVVEFTFHAKANRFEVGTDARCDLAPFPV
jgi:hypothetical protein